MIDKITHSNKPARNTKTSRNTGYAANFTGAAAPVLNTFNWMKNNPALSACGVDICSMVLPRTAVETKNRGVQSGIETFIREMSSALINASIGLIGFLSASAVSGRINKRGIKAQNIFASGDAVKNFSELWIKADGNADKFFKSFLENIKGLNGAEWRSISENIQENTVLKLKELAEKTENFASSGRLNRSELKRSINSLKTLISAQIIKDTGAETTFKAAGSENAKEISAGLSELIDSAVQLFNAFKKPAKEDFPRFVQELMKNKKHTAVLGLGICAAASIAAAPLNRFFTKKRTGKDSFVGVKGDAKDNSAGFKALKTAAGIGFPIFAVSTIGCKPKDLPANLQFNGRVPRISQFKLIYGLTIGSRLLCARDGNELRESLIKDTLGFSTWLIFGDFVSKLTARAIGGKDIINNPAAKEGSKKGLRYFKEWLMKSSVKSFSEILMPSVKDSVKDNKVMSLNELYQKAGKDLKSKVLAASAAQAAGYLFSGIVLGMGITKLNIFITRKLNEHKAGSMMNKKINEKQKFDAEYLSKKISSSSPVFKEFAAVSAVKGND